ncbi:MAG: hypothetical protein A4S16_03470 [Proteobacteria bacterium SG_bin6]|nr:MAG: hypothetical protein A4S16_03470 [Proteobacteria bacterium SG_bin6]
MAPELTPFDPARYLNTPEAVEAYLEAAMEDGEPEHIARAMDDVQRSSVIEQAKEGGFIARDPVTGSTTQGETAVEAIANLREAVELFCSEFPRHD